MYKKLRDKFFSKLRKNYKQIFSWLTVFLWMILIFLLSNMSSYESNLKSENMINKTIEVTLNKTNDLGLTNKHPSNKKIKLIVEELNFPLRKIMHFSVYFVLALLLLMALKKSSFKKKKVYLLTLLICLLYALLDEYHQTFISGRTGNLYDCLIDIFGSGIGLVFSIIYSKIKNKNKMKE